MTQLPFEHRNRFWLSREVHNAKGLYGLFGDFERFVQDGGVAYHASLASHAGRTEVFEQLVGDLHAIVEAADASVNVAFVHNEQHSESYVQCRSGIPGKAWVTGLALDRYLTRSERNS